VLFNHIGSEKEVLKEFIEFESRIFFNTGSNTPDGGPNQSIDKFIINIAWNFDFITISKLRNIYLNVALNVSDDMLDNEWTNSRTWELAIDSGEFDTKISHVMEVFLQFIANFIFEKFFKTVTVRCYMDTMT
jgi:hypothetical protein